MWSPPGGHCRALWAIGLLLLAGLLTSCQRGDAPIELEAAVLDFTSRSQPDGGGYEPPTPAAVRDLSEAVVAVAEGREDDARPRLARYGYRLTDVRRGRLVMPERVPDGRGWGLYAIRPGGRPVAVEVPHPRSDLETERIGAMLAERLQAQHLLMAGAHRDRGGPGADVAHEPDSLFAGVHARLARDGLPAIQVHGFANLSSPGNDVVVSPGGAPLSPLAQRVADGLEESGFVTCRAWAQECGRLEGRTNSQSATSAEAGAPFVHLEVSRSVRTDPARRRQLVESLGAVAMTLVPMP